LVLVEQALNNALTVEQMVNTAKTPPPVPSAAAPRRRLSASDREQQILAGAVAFFARRGFDAQTRELAAEIGITHALLYHYFPTKQALIDRVYETVFIGRWDPQWETLLDGPLPAEDKLCRFYGAYLAAILTPEWLRIFMYSGMSDGLIPERYFGLLRERLFPRLLREARRAHGLRSRAAPTAREEGLLMGLHGGLVYHLGVLPLCYGQGFRGQGDPALVACFIRDQVQGYLAHMGTLLAEQSAAAARPAAQPASQPQGAAPPARAPSPRARRTDRAVPAA
jgi:AcrR family transcriptional regulator